MANEKILILEAPWSSDIADTRATRQIYLSAETLLSVHPEPIRIIQRPLVSSTYLKDIEDFISLKSNQRGPNVVIFSAHGSYALLKRSGGKKHRRELQAFDGDVNISKQIRSLSASLGRTIIILDACKIGKDVKSFRDAAGALGVIGFSKIVDWIDSSVFVLALLLHFQSGEVFHLKRARTNTGSITPRPERIVQEMINSTYKSLAKSLGVQYDFGA